MNWNIINQPLGQGDLSGGYAPAKKRIIPLVIMAAAAAGSAIYSGVKSAQRNRQAQGELDKGKAMTSAKRRRLTNERYIDTAQGQNLIRKANEEADRVWQREEGTARVMGSTDASKQMAKDASRRSIGEAIADIADRDMARQEHADEVYEARESQLRQQQIALDQQRAADQAQVGSQLISSLGNAAAAYAGTYMGSPGGAGVTAGKQSTDALKNMGGGSSTNTSVTNYQNSFDSNFWREYAMRNMGTLFGGSPRYHVAEK